MKEIVQRDHPALRAVAEAVAHKDISSEKIDGIIADMKKAMSSQKDGVAIAAPQIGVSLRIFVVSGAFMKQVVKSYKGDGSDMVFINPEMIKSSREKKEVEEGCLSVRWLYGKVKRSARVTISGFNEKGEKIERGAGGLLAQIFQHEIDHLNGILFTDRAKETWEMSEAEVKDLQRG
ncbi:MAG: peptide deformylase [Candidatus Parcubacteria bacterium]|jgi:peptide deformylase|nr:peptide deformylase [Candidatus Parcubacteria bacterium]